MVTPVPVGFDPFSEAGLPSITGGDARSQSSADLFSDTRVQVEFAPVTVGSATGGVISSGLAIAGLILVVVIWLTKK